jgi:hypothetical protein
MTEALLSSETSEIFAILLRHNPGQEETVISVDENKLLHYLLLYFFTYITFKTGHAIVLDGNVINITRYRIVKFRSLVRGPFEKFVNSCYYSEWELCGGAVTVSFSK